MGKKKIPDKSQKRGKQFIWDKGKLVDFNVQNRSIFDLLFGLPCGGLLWVVFLVLALDRLPSYNVNPPTQDQKQIKKIIKIEKIILLLQLYFFILNILVWALTMRPKEKEDQKCL